jgi:hypothetical protein
MIDVGVDVWAFTREVSVAAGGAVVVDHPLLWSTP